MKKLFFIIACIFLLSESVLAQGSLEAALKEIRAQGRYDTVVYFGVDFSKVRINDAPKISQGVSYSQVYPSAWIAFVEKELPPYSYVKKSLGIKNFLYNQQEIFEASIDVSPRFIIGSDNFLPSDSIDKIVTEYKLQTASGLGMVLIPELFSKPQETAYTWIVFFDIKSRDVLYKGKTHGKCSHMGYTAHWASGVVLGFQHFASH